MKIVNAGSRRQEVLAGERSRRIKLGLSADPAVYLRDPCAAARASPRAGD